MQGRDGGGGKRVHGQQAPYRRSSAIFQQFSELQDASLFGQSCVAPAFEKVFDFLSEEGSTTVSKVAFMDDLESKGILSDDPRIKDVMRQLKKIKKDALDKDEFITVIAGSISLLEKIYTDDVAIPDFADFHNDIQEIYDAVKPNRGGTMADYIPNLAKQNPDHWGVAVCTVDGQRLHLGDTDVEFCIQSCSKPLTYCMALEEHGVEKVHKHVGREPSGEEFNALKLNKKCLPHNPLINSGAIMTCSLIKQQEDAADRFDYVTKKWAKLAGNKKPGFSNTVYLSERETADRNFALAYFMNESGAFPAGTNLIRVLEFYFQCCSLTMDADALSVVAGTLANGGICPLTGEQVLQPETVRHCLSMMYSCGMYDYSGEFAFRIGLPAKSGVAGGVFVVVPNVAGFCTFSPPLDGYGNSERGVDFFTRLVGKFNFHNFDSLTDLVDEGKKDPRKRHDANASSNNDGELTDLCIKYCSLGDVSGLKRLRLRGCDFDVGDYDHRTPLHLATSNGHMNIVKFLISQKLVQNVNPIDRWGGTPLDDAEKEGFENCVEYLVACGAHRGPQKRRSLILKGCEVGSSTVIQTVPRPPEESWATSSVATGEF